jgi:hypothetical protein
MEKPAQQEQWQNGEQDSSSFADCCVFVVSFPGFSLDNSCVSAQGTQLSVITSKAIMKAKKRMDANLRLLKVKNEKKERPSVRRKILERRNAPEMLLSFKQRIHGQFILYQ